MGRPSLEVPLSLATTARGRTQLDLLAAQLRAIDAWNAAHRGDLSDVGALSREQRLDVSRRAEALERERRALHARAEVQLLASGAPLGQRHHVRAVLAHRNAWLREAVATRLAGHGVSVVGAFEDGADVAGTVVVEQPELVLVEDRLPTLSGADVVRRVRTYVPEAVVAVQCQDSSGVAALVDAGAHAVFTRRIPPGDIVDRMLACLQGEADLPVAVC